MLARHPSPPALAAPRGRLRAAYRLAAGLSPAVVARAEAVAEGEIAALLARPDFQALVTALRELQDLPEAERLRQLEVHAWQVLELALVDGDWRAAAFITNQIRLGNSPARTLAQGAIRAQGRATAPPPTQAAEPDPAASPPPSRAPRPYDPVGAAMRLAAAAHAGHRRRRGRPGSRAAGGAGRRDRAPGARPAPPPGCPRRPPARRRRQPADRDRRHHPARPAARLGTRPLTVSAARAASPPAPFPLLTGTACRNQAFRIGDVVYGFSATSRPTPRTWSTGRNIAAASMAGGISRRRLPGRRVCTVKRPKRSAGRWRTAVASAAASGSSGFNCSARNLCPGPG